jgi:energy-converting hydrogenase A subunit R
MRQFSREHLLLVPEAKETLQQIGVLMEAFIISTSYEPYIDALCEVTEFPKHRTYSTQVSLDRYFLKNEERERLIHLAKEVQAMEMIDWPEGALGLEDLSDRDRKTIRRLDRIFWEEIQEMAIGKILSEVNPVGGKEKANAVLLSLERTGNRLEEVIYVGDSITDVEAFDLVRRGGGLTLSFNGNRYALRSIVADAFRKGGREGVMEIVDRWEPNSLASFGIDPKLVHKLESIPSSIQFEGYPKVDRVTNENKGRIIQESEAFRKQVRGIAVGSLG